MKFLVICSIFPPDAMGGAELSAYHCAKWLIGQGHEVSVLTTAKVRSDEIRGVPVDGMKIWRLFWPRLYPIHNHERQSSIRKIAWHMQDHFHPANLKILTEVIQQVQPDFINLHLVAGIGANALSVLKDFPHIPILYFLHDLCLACVRSTMYRSGTNCVRKCLECRISSFLKFGHIHRENIYNFVSPSAANLKTLEEHTPIRRFSSTVVPNFDFETSPVRVNRAAGAPLRFIFIGRLHATKGVHFLLSVFKELASEGRSFHIRIVGGGPEEKSLRESYQPCQWVTFTGRIAPSQVKSELSVSDVLCVPSLWRENHPGVVRQALRAGVPALVSDNGGSSEMIDNGQSGIVLPTADRKAWKSALLELILNGDVTERLQNGAFQSARKYDIDVVGRQLNAVIERAMEEMHGRKDVLPVVYQT
jgi:glycosyltransferase involved in cell wall biosynthesis